MNEFPSQLAASLRMMGFDEVHIGHAAIEVKGATFYAQGFGSRGGVYFLGQRYYRRRAGYNVATAVIDVIKALPGAMNAAEKQRREQEAEKALDTWLISVGSIKEHQTSRGTWCKLPAPGFFVRTVGDKYEFRVAEIRDMATLMIMADWLDEKLNELQ